MDTVGTPIARPALDAVLAGQPIGTWVLLDTGMSRVLGAGQTVEEAIRNAKLDPSGERPVMIQVPDPSAICFF